MPSRVAQVDKTRANNAEKAAGNEDGNEGRPPVVTTITGTAAAAADTATPPTTGPDFLRFFENAGGLPPETYVCAVCEEPARGFHFGAFTCEGCKSFFGRTCLRKNHERFECKNSGRCDVVVSFFEGFFVEYSKLERLMSSEAFSSLVYECNENRRCSSVTRLPD
ncbi:hypothetical protein GCK32_018200 [Trichostrongylus colubriformis]|uniref:Nuclear receptor domain-containing protein n=1 Tax=Trichostrongylus colubriformis TaxID=6319 RepID=A0AAN8FTW7_TRICO